VFLLLIVVATSAIAYVLGRRRKPAVPLRSAFGKALECLGLALAFFLADVAVGGLTVLLVRSTGRFVSVYGLSDPTLLVLALGQALVLHHWLVERPPHRP
jgi:hypothetical protein